MPRDLQLERPLGERFVRPVEFKAASLLIVLFIGVENGIKPFALQQVSV
jgi:hypothetical protein